MTPFMKVGLAQIKTGENAFVFSTSKDPWLKELSNRLAAAGTKIPGNIEIALQLTKLEPDYYLRGQMTFEVDQTCARCADSFPLPIEHTVALGMAHVGSQAVEGVLSEESEELDINYFEGTDLDFGPIIEEQILLSLPYRAMCRPDCKGICQSCGSDLNKGDCRCPKTNPVHAFAALAQINIKENRSH
jgi:uncharacterized protein